MPFGFINLAWPMMPDNEGPTERNSFYEFMKVNMKSKVYSKR